MEQYHNDTNNNNPNRKKTATATKIYRRFTSTIALPSVLLVLIFIASVPTDQVQATGGSNETAATQAPGGASVGPAGGGTNVTQSACLPQNATTTGRPALDAGAATTTNNTTTTVAPGGASIGANDTSTLNATAGNTITTNNTTTTVAPGGASIGANDTSTLNATAGNTAGNTSTTFAPSGASIC
jgi:hypothetical protein